MFFPDTGIASTFTSWFLQPANDQNSTRRPCCGIGATGKPSGLPTPNPAFACSEPPSAAGPAAGPNTWPTATLQRGLAASCSAQKKKNVANGSFGQPRQAGRTTLLSSKAADRKSTRLNSSHLGT